MSSLLFKGPVAIIALVVVVLAALFFQIGAVPLFDEDEGAYAEVSREMVTSGNWLVPTLEGKPFFHKPPVIYWTQAICLRIFGVNELALRLPSTLASLAWSGILFFFVRRHIGTQPAWFAVFFLVSALQTSIIARAAIPDALLNLFITTAMLALYTHYQSGSRWWLLVVYGASALGFLTKGPIAVAIPAVVSLVFYILQKGILPWLRIIFNPLGWLVFVMIAAPWYIALIQDYGMRFIGDFFLVHNLGRFQNAMEGHTGPIFYYFPIIIVGLLPFTSIVVKAFAEMGRQWRSDLGRYLILWFAFVLVLFSLAETKLPHYIIYGYVPLLIFMSQVIDQLKRPALLVMPLAIFAIFILLLPLIAAWLAPQIDDAFSQIVIQSALPEFGWHHFVIMGIVTILAFALCLKSRLSISLKIVAMGLLFLITINGYLLPKVADIMQQPIKSAALFARKNNIKEVVMWQMYYPSFSVYQGHPVLRRDPLPGDVVITKANKLDGIESHRILFQKHGFVLTRINKL